MKANKGLRYVTTERIKVNAEGLTTAANLLRDGALVAFPTETVYGLGADATNGAAVARVFEAKGRPSFNPLIVHVPDLASARGIGAFSGAAERLVAEGWPEALTLVLPLKPSSRIAPLVTAGNATVALRIPAHATARALLEACGRPVAAPSANPSGRISATTADHVIAGLGGRIDAVLDGGPTQVGLESTILGFDRDTPVVLREGGFIIDGAQRSTVFTPSAGKGAAAAPGQFSSHYAPKARVRLNAVTAEPGEILLGFGAVTGDLSLSASGDLVEAAANLFA
ncbi:MAG: L-threonylcarbamoyladenylate synthase, partial [Pseudomonadota bacterium]